MFGITHAIVLYAHDPDLTRQFYEALGLAFVEEKHGDGPVHHSCDLEGIVMEIYPRRAKPEAGKHDDLTAMFFFIGEFEKTLEALKAMGLKPGTVGTSAQSPNLRAASIRDPDGRLVRLCERDTSLLQ